MIRKETTHIILHHAAVQKPDTSDGLWLAQLAKNRLHLVSRKIKSIAEYHIVIARNGSIHYVVDFDEWLGHCGSDEMNEKSIAICLEGNMEVQYLTTVQHNSLCRVCLDMMKRYGKKLEIWGHDRVAATACPGKNVKPWDIQVDAFNLFSQKPSMIMMHVGINSAVLRYKTDTHGIHNIPIKQPPFIWMGRGYINIKSLKELGFHEPQKANRWGNVLLTDFTKQNWANITWSKDKREWIITSGG